MLETDGGERKVLCDESGFYSDIHQPSLSSASQSISLAWLMTWKSFALLLMDTKL